MYQLKVFHEGATTPTATLAITRASEVLARIPEVLAQHADCARIDVIYDGQKLFAVDCEGNHLT